MAARKSPAQRAKDKPKPTPAPTDTTQTPLMKPRKMTWGQLKLRFSDRHKDFDESRDS